jgi:hypothetical protein
VFIPRLAWTAILLFIGEDIARVTGMLNHIQLLLVEMGPREHFVQAGLKLPSFLSLPHKVARITDVSYHAQPLANVIFNEICRPINFHWCKKDVLQGVNVFCKGSVYPLSTQLLLLRFELVFFVSK